MFLNISVRCISERFNLVLQNVKKDYEAKQSEGKSGKEMFGLAWDVKELGDLNEVGRELTVECTTFIDKILNPSYDRIANNLANQISAFRERALSFVKRVTKYRREPATHVLVVLISPEERNKKPYALAVQCIAYKSIKDAEVRKIYNNVVKEMTARQMKVAGVYGTCMINILLLIHYTIQAGFTSNGEWNSLRSKGNSRPLSIFEVRSLARRKYSHLSTKRMIGMLTPKCESVLNVHKKALLIELCCMHP